MTRIVGRVAAAWVLLAWPIVAVAEPPAAEPMVFSLTATAVEGSEIALKPIVLRVPSGYAPAQAAMRVTEGPSLSVLAMYPSYTPFVAGPGRCGTMLCGDEVGAKIELAPVAPPGRTQPGSLRKEMEAKVPEGGPETTFADAPVPGGFEEAFMVERAALPGRTYTHMHLEYLVYRDKQDVQRVGSCGVDGGHPSCTFRTFDPATRIVMTYSLPRSALGKRDTIEAQLQSLFAKWRVAGP